MKFNTKKYWQFLPILKNGLASATVIGTLLFAGCGTENRPQLRVVHTSPDAPKVNVSLNGATVISELDYAQSSGYINVNKGSYKVIVEAIVPGGNIDAITINDFKIAENNKTTVFAIDKVASITSLVVKESAAKPSSKQVAINVIHAAPSAPEVDVYVTTPDAALPIGHPSLTFSFSQQVDVGKLSATQARIRVTLKGTDTVVYDSGTLDLSGFKGQSILLAAVDTTNATSTLSSPIKLIAVTADASLSLLDKNTSAGVKIVHASPDAAAAAGGPVGVFATSSVLGSDPVKLIDAFNYTDIIPAANTSTSVPAADDYGFDVAPSTESIAASIFNVSNVSLIAGFEYSVVAAGRVLGSPSFSLLLTEDDNRSVITQSKLKVIHAAPAAGNVDIYVTPAGTVSTSELHTIPPALANFAYGTITDYIDLAVGSYDVRVVADGNVAINVEGLSLSAGSVVTAIARGPSEPSGTPSDFGLLLLTNK
jgi:hypothetical protein